jgi:transcriptional regulator with XRE-family HTH domain
MSKYDWPGMLREIQDTLFMSQSDMAERLHVSQQYTSMIMTGKRIPGAKTQAKLLEFAAKHGISVAPADPAMAKLERFVESGKGVEFIRVIRLYSRMSPANKKKYITYAESLD